MAFAPYMAAAGSASPPRRLAPQLGLALCRIRAQLAGGFLFGVLAPEWLRGGVVRVGEQIVHNNISMIGATAALLLGYLIFRKTAALPGPGVWTHVAPAFLTAYAVVMALFFALRLDYSRYQFLASFLLTNAWFYTALYASNRLWRPAFGLVDGPGAAELASTPGVAWRRLATPAQAEANRDLPLVADFDDPGLSPAWTRRLANEVVGGRPVFHARKLREALTGRVQIQRLSENTFGHLSPDALYAPAKRYIDAASALLALAALAPILAPIAAVIRLDSPGPAIFRQQRGGYRGRTFTVYKFRTMRRRAPAETTRDADITEPGDTRVTRLGRLLRRTRIDELPQIVNILRGEMSWIGPRPETLALSAWYEAEIPFYRYRHVVRPGITGWAQVNQGHVAGLDAVRAKLEYDFYYVREFSLWIDIVIAIRTVKVVLTGQGAK